MNLIGCNLTIAEFGEILEKDYNVERKGFYGEWI